MAPAPSPLPAPGPRWPCLIGCGLAMGSADVVPGVSGGSVAFFFGLIVGSIVLIARHAPWGLIGLVAMAAGASAGPWWWVWSSCSSATASPRWVVESPDGFSAALEFH